MVPRIEDLPYISSPPIEFTYRSTASVSAGSYTWLDTPMRLDPVRPLMVQGVYYFRSITLAADCDEKDFMANILVTPKFQMYLKSRSKSILFREPIYMTKFFQNFDYRLCWITRQDADELFASFTGTIFQGSQFVGKQSITLNAIISCQEIVDENFVNLFEQTYPNVRK